MIVVARVVVGIALLAHGLVHLLFLAPDEPTFSFGWSWLVPDGARRQLGIGGLVATVAAFAVLALSVWGVPGLSAAWPAITVVAALLSALLLLVLWDPVLGRHLACRPHIWLGPQLLSAEPGAN
jgi:hypothetical protein